MKPRSLSSRLKHVIDVLVKNTADNGAGGRKVPEGQPAWRTTDTDLPAEVIALRGDEAVRLGVERSIQLWRVTVRAGAEIDTKSQLMWGTITMKVKSAALDLTGTALVMTCESGFPGA
ncbi:phage head completion protein [Sphingomonas melonis]|uniref:Head-tail adaptor n=1 Tax=Sphingomonas melonis TaxID=152682 RepID=A0A7Y9K1V7_9SPHN|nr:head-tail adaptor protein [Sphingomonas melonis]NYD91398.1 head-tail adaptor [Sphingomonas melonis]